MIPAEEIFSIFSPKFGKDNVMILLLLFNNNIVTRIIRKMQFAADSRLPRWDLFFQIMFAASAVDIKYIDTYI